MIITFVYMYPLMFEISLRVKWNESNVKSMKTLFLQIEQNVTVRNVDVEYEKCKFYKRYMLVDVLIFVYKNTLINPEKNLIKEIDEIEYHKRY